MGLYNLDRVRDLTIGQVRLWRFLEEELVENERIGEYWAWSRLLYIILNKDW